METQSRGTDKNVFPDLKKDSPSTRGTGNKKSNNSNIPPTKIPEQYHVKQIAGTPSTDPDYKTEYDEKTKQWKTTIFPSLKPGGRQEVVLLDKWLNDMLAENLAKNLEPIESVKEAQELYSACFHEICRQVYVQCAERGKLMEKIWNRYLQLFDHILKIREREKFSQTQKLEQQKSVYQKLYKEKDDKFNKAYLQLAADKEKITMSKDKLERAVLVLQEEYKKRVKQEANLRQALKKQQHQLSRAQIAQSLHDEKENNKKDQGTHSPASDTKSDGKRRVRISDEDNGRDENDEEFHRSSSGLSMQSVDSFSRYDEEDADDADDVVDIIKVEELEFSNSNLILVSKLGFVTKSLRSIHKVLTGSANNYEDTYNTTQQLGSVLEAIIDVVNRLEHPESSQEPKAPPPIKALSTLYALRAPVEKATQTMELEVGEAIPAYYATYFAKSLRVPVVHIKDKRYVFACISHVFTQKIKDEEETPTKKPTRLPLPQYLYELFLRIFGIRMWAEMHLLDFLASVRKYSQQNLRIKMFARFAHIGEELFSPYTTDDLNFYLYPSRNNNSMNHFRPQQGKTAPPDAPIIREAKDGSRTVALTAAIATIHTVFPDIENVAKESMIRVIENCAQIDETDGISSVIDMDKYLEVLLEEYHLRCNQLSKRFQKTLEENVSAPLPDNLLLYDEFLTCLNSTFRAGISDSEAMTMYREILDGSSLNAVDASTVVEVVRRCTSLFCWKSYTSQIDKAVTEFYIIRFMEVNWETTKLDLLEKLKKIQLDGNVDPRLSSQLQEKLKNFQSSLANGYGTAALNCYRQLLVQIFFASKKQNRIISGEYTPPDIKDEEPQDESPPPSP